MYFICLGKLLNLTTAFYIIKNKIIIDDSFFSIENTKNGYVNKDVLIKYLFETKNTINYKIIDLIRKNKNIDKNNTYICTVDICKSIIDDSKNYLYIIKENFCDNKESYFFIYIV